MQFWLTQTELRNASATYNPMTLDELTKLFAIVCACTQMYVHVLSLHVCTHRIG